MFNTTVVNPDPTTGLGTSNTISTTGWTDVKWSEGANLPEYYSSSGSGTRTVTAGNNFSTSISTGTSQAVLSGTVSGISGQTLTGPVTVTGTDSFGQTITYTATITVDPSGVMSFSYTNGNLSGPWRSATATGTVTYTPGSYFTQTLDGSILQTGGPVPGAGTNPPYYNVQTGSSTWAGGSRTGVLPGYYSATITGTETSPWPYTYQPNGYGNPTSTVMGVVSPGTGGTFTGAFTFIPTNPDTPFMSALPLAPSPYLFPNWEFNSAPMVGSVTIASNGSATGTLYDIYYQNGRFNPGNYTISQTAPTQNPQVTPPASATYDFTQTFNGAMYLNANAPGSTSTSIVAQGVGWGLRTGTTSIPGAVTGDLPLPASYSGWFMASKNAIWTLTSGGESSLPGNFGSAIGVTQMSGRVTGVLGQALSGNMTFAGSLLGGTSFIYNGPVAITTTVSWPSTTPAPGFPAAAAAPSPGGWTRARVTISPRR